MTNKKSNKIIKKKIKKITFTPIPLGTKAYCGNLDILPSMEYDHFGSRRECLDIGLGVGRRLEYIYLQKLLYREGYEIPELI